MKMYGAQVSSSTCVRLGFASGARFEILATSPDGEHAALAIAELAIPATIERSWAQLQQTGAAVFGDKLRITQQGIDVKRGKGWYHVPRERVAGYCVRDAMLMLDENPARPFLFADFVVGTVENLDAFLTLLDALYPQRNLAEFPYPPGLASGRSAANYTPSAFNARSCLIMGAMIGGFAAFGALCVVLKYMEEHNRPPPPPRKEEALWTMAQENVKAMAADTPPTERLRARCAGKVPGPTGLGYVAEMSGNAAWEKPIYMRALGSVDTSDSKYSYYESHLDQVFYVGSMLPQTTLVLGGRSHVRMHVRVLEPKTKALLCEGLVEADFEPNWLHQKADYDQRSALANGPPTAMVRELCDAADTSALCNDARRGSKNDFDKAAADAGTASSARKKPGPAPKKR
jgi:hypothetical protein